MTQVQIFLDEDDLFENKPLYEYILRYLMHHSIRGATLFRGEMGFGAQHHLHAPDRLGALDERPLMITFIDDDATVRSVVANLRTFMHQGLIISSHVEDWSVRFPSAT